jgi:hypothetical protein
MSKPETMTEGVAEYHGMTDDGNHVVHVKLTVLHADPELNFHQGAILHVDPELFEGLDANSLVPIVEVRK